MHSSPVCLLTSRNSVLLKFEAVFSLIRVLVVNVLHVLQSLAEAYRSNGKTLHIFHGDVLKFNMTDLFPVDERRGWLEPPPQISVIGNLPFSVSTPLIIKWLSQISAREGVWR